MLLSTSRVPWHRRREDARFHAPADADAAGAHVVDEVAYNSAILAAATQPECIAADAADLAALDRDVLAPSARMVAGVVTEACPSPCPWQAAVLVMEDSQPLRATCSTNCPLADRHHADSSGTAGATTSTSTCLRRQGDVGERAVAIEEPFARRVQRRAEVLDVVALVHAPVEKRHGALPVVMTRPVFGSADATRCTETSHE